MKKTIILAIIAVIGGAACWLLAGNINKVNAADQNNCLSCHGNFGLSKTNGNGEIVSLYVNNTAVQTAAHRYIDCTTCHTAEPHKVNTPLTKLSLAQKCGTCHQYEYQEHLKSVHGEQLVQGNQDVATCVDCHSADSNPHSIIRVLEYGSSAYKKNISDTCGQCHGNEDLMTSYGILEKVYESYMRSFHGKAIKLGAYEISQLDEATCTNCHGTHSIKRVTDPTSPVAGLDSLVQTCEQCHPGAGLQFAAGFLGHSEASPENIPPAHYTEILFTVILVSVVAFGVIVTGIAAVRYSINRWRE